MKSDSGRDLIGRYRLLHVDLSNKTITSEPIPEDLLVRFLGGKGLGAAYLYRETPPNVDPQSPENCLIFMLGPLTGIAPASSRCCVLTKSPLTGALTDCYSGGRFPAHLRYSMPDHLGMVIHGAAANPVMLVIEDGTAEIRDADHLWGLDTKETAAALNGYTTAAIGPAGENLVKFSTISTDGGIHHAARGGPGAVMGAKRLKAIAVKPASEPEMPQNLRNLRREHMRHLRTTDDLAATRDEGTISFLAPVNEVGALPTRYWTEGRFERVDAIDTVAVQRHTKKRVTCHACPIACGYNLAFPEDGGEVFETGKGPEYETVVLNGPLLDIGDLKEIARIGELCDRLGVDTMSTGNVLGFAMECHEMGVLDHPIHFGDGKGARDLITLIAKREGIGDLLAEGVRAACQKLYNGSLEHAVEVKGLECPSFDPRASYGLALAYATSDRGGCHTRALPIVTDALGGERDPYSVEGQAEAVIADQNFRALTYSLIACDFAEYSPEQALRWLNALGFDLSGTDLGVTGERIWNMTRLFNTREGFSRAADSMPERFGEPLQGGGPAAGNAVRPEEFKGMLDEYYHLRTWDEDGIPTPECIQRLGLADFSPAQQAGGRR